MHGGCSPENQRWSASRRMSRAFQGRLSVPDLDDLARLALRRAYERVRDGDVSPRDRAAILRVARKSKHDAAVAQAEKARARAGRSPSA